MWSEKLLKQIDAYLEAYSLFEQYDWDSFYAKLIEYAENMYDSITKERDLAIAEYQELQSPYNAWMHVLIKKKKCDDEKAEHKRLKNKISQIEKKIEDKFAQEAKWQSEIVKVNQKKQLKKRIPWANLDAENKEIEALIRRLEKNDDEITKFKKELATLREESNSMKNKVLEAEQEKEKLKGEEISSKLLREAEERQVELWEIINACNDLLLTSINEFEPFSHESFLDFRGWKDVFWSPANIKTMGTLAKDFTDLQRVLCMCGETPFMSVDSLPDTYSIPCQNKHDEIMRSACRALKTNDSKVFQRFPAEVLEYKEAFEQLVECQGDMRQVLETVGGTKGSQKTLHKRDELFYDAVNFCFEKGEISYSKLQKTFDIDYDRARHIVYSMSYCGLVGPEKAKGTHVLYCDIREPYRDITGGYCDIRELSLDVAKTGCCSKEQYVAKHIYRYVLWVLSKDFLLEMKSIVENNPELNLPGLALELLKITKEEGLEDSIRDFKKLYEASPEEVMILNHRYLKEEELELLADQCDKADARERCRNCASYYSCNTVGTVMCEYYRPRG